MRPIARQLLVPILCILPLASQSGCARNPVTGDLQLALISEAQEIQMGQQAAQDVATSIGLVDDPELQQYVSRLGQQLAAASERPELPWSFAVVDDPTPNAFALPGGPIFITRGLMNLMSTEAQLVSVLGHEIGHVTARHHVTRLSRQQLAQVGLGVGGILFPDLQQLGGIAGAGLQLVFLSHGRDAERQADDLGFRYSLDQGYDVREMALVFESLQRLGDTGESSSIPSWLMTHPAPAERIEYVQERLATVDATSGQLRIGTQPYLSQLEGLVYGENPRNGFFRDGLFLHPDLRFQVAFPGQWPRQNLAQAVMAISPQQDGAIQLTLAEEDTPTTAARRFLSEQGIQPGQTAQQSINGLPAILASFRAQAQQGQTLQGIVGFVAHGGSVYQIMGYAPVGVYGTYDQLFQQTLRSFRPLTDPETLSVQPERVSIVRTPETMRLSEFDRRFPSAVSIDELALINQLTGADALIPGGTLMKRVLPG
ncbi:MAG: M48 family metalloprotease [Gemmatimonadota bacterium]